ncbi:MAG: endonuclease [Gammaproteobacteria bacterium]|nr:MAG: endonuclease [Gammaproteobacteria bacterium]
MLTIASYNIRKSVGLDWQRDPQRIHAVIAELDADIVLLQEVDKRFGSRQGTLCKHTLFTDLHYHFADIATHPNSHGWHGNVILYRPPLKLLDCQRVNIPSVEPRGAIMALFGLSNNSVLQVVGTHLSLLKRMRQRQIASILHQIRQARHDYIVIGGDFNEAKADKWFINNPLLTDYRLITPGPSFHTAKPLRALDRFIVGRNISVRGSLVHRSPQTRKASDHLPIMIKLELPLC